MKAYTAPLIGAAAALLLTLAFSFLLYSPKVDEQRQYEQETAQLEEQQRQLTTQIAQLREVEDNEVAIRAELARLEQYIPNGASQPSVIREFQVSADRAGVDIASVTFGDPVAPQNADGTPAEPVDTGVPDMTLASVPTTMVIQGGYFQIVDFLRRVEGDVPRAVLMNGLNVAEEGEDGFPTLTATWSGQLFAVVPTSDVIDPATAAAAAQPSGGAEEPSEQPTEGQTEATS